MTPVLVLFAALLTPTVHHGHQQLPCSMCDRNEFSFVISPKDQGREQKDPIFFHQMDLDTLQKAITKMGFSCTRGEDNEYFTFLLQGYRVGAFVDNEGTDAEFYFSAGDLNSTIERMNKWNRKFRFGRAYLDKKGRGVLIFDLDFDGGVSIDRLESAIRMYRNMVVRFVQFCVEGEQPSTIPLAIDPGASDDQQWPD